MKSKATHFTDTQLDAEDIEWNTIFYYFHKINAFDRSSTPFPTHKEWQIRNHSSETLVATNAFFFRGIDHSQNDYTHPKTGGHDPISFHSKSLLFCIWFAVSSGKSNANGRKSKGFLWKIASIWLVIYYISNANEDNSKTCIESPSQKKTAFLFLKRFDSSVLPTNEILIIVDVASQHKKKQKKNVQFKPNVYEKRY